MTVASRKLFLIGPGYSARQLANVCKAHGGWTIFGTARSADKADGLRDEGIVPVRADDPAAIAAASKDSHFLISTPPGDTGCPGFALAGQHAGEAASVTYLSTTGVYGDLDGGWAFEWLPANPGSDRGQKRADAEAQWMGARPDARMIRLPGIYGPGRSQIERLQSGKTEQMVKPGQVFSRIHLEDLASGLYALLTRPHLSGVFNLCDDEPAPPETVMDFAADLIGVERPEHVTLDEADASAMARSFYSECKRVPNAKLKAATGWRPQYPTYREGLTAIFKAQKN